MKGNYYEGTYRLKTLSRVVHFILLTSAFFSSSTYFVFNYTLSLKNYNSFEHERSFALVRCVYLYY